VSFPELKDKVFLVTGASTGIGAAVARSLGAEGAKVAVHYNRSRAAAEEVLADISGKGGEGYGIEGDVTMRGVADAVVRLAVERFGRLDGLINNAGSLLERRAPSEWDDAYFDAVVDLNARSVATAARAAIPHLARTCGTIINTTSIAARHGGGPGAVLYAAAKGFVSTLTRGLAKELVNDGIRVNAVAPGVIATPLHARLSTDAQIAAMVATVPMARVGTVEECVGAYLFLASPALSGYVTGQVIEVNGGQLMP
jgi:3-oxoacyl-[acyl-carrier protein] reductase